MRSVHWGRYTVTGLDDRIEWLSVTCAVILPIVGTSMIITILL